MMSVVLSRNNAAKTLPVHSFRALCYLLVRRNTAIARLRLSCLRFKCRLASALLGLVGVLPVVQAQVCFDRAGTFGSLTVTTAGSGCGTFLNYGGISGLWLGDTNVNESCTFNFAPALVTPKIEVQMTAHSCVPGYCEEARFSLNGSHYVVAPGELDNSRPPGGEPMQITGAGDIVDGASGRGDGRGTVTFSRAPSSTNSLNISHVITSGQPNGTIYRICVDAPVEKIEVTLVPAPANDKYLITATPAMPSISATAKVVGVTPDPTASTTFTWDLDLTTTKGTGQKVSHASYFQQGANTVGLASYNVQSINPAALLGGDLQLKVSATVGNKQLTGATSPSLAIYGTNPQRTQIQDRVDTAVDARTFSGLSKGDVKDAMKRMACRESRQVQFRGQADGGIGPALISPDNGTGIFQITSGDPIVNKPAVVYDWRANVDAGATTFAEKAKFARGYPALLRNSAQYKKYVSETINPARCTSGLQPIGLPSVPPDPANTFAARCLGRLTTIPGNPPAPDFPSGGMIGSNPINMLLEDGVRGYNGFAGPSLYGSVLHEFRPDVDFLTSASNALLANLGTNTAVWHRVPIADRGNSGDPNYVGNVTVRTTACN